MLVHRYRWPLLAAVVFFYLLSPLILLWLRPSWCVPIGPEPATEEAIPLPDVFGKNRVSQSLHSPYNSLAGITLRITAQFAGDEATVILEDTSSEKSYSAVIPASQISTPYVIALGSEPNSRNKDYTLMLMGPKNDASHRISVDVIPGNAYLESELSVNNQSVEADLAFQLCYRPTSLPTSLGVWEVAFRKWWSPYDLVLNRMSQYKPDWLKKPYQLALVTIGAVGLLMLFTAQLSKGRVTRRKAVLAAEKAPALFLVVVAYVVSTNMTRQLKAFPNWVTAETAESGMASLPGGGETIIYDFLLATATGQAVIERPDNVDVRWFGLGGEARPVLFMHPPASAAYNITVPPAATLVFAPALSPEVWLPEYGDGVLFTIEIDDGEHTETLFSRTVDAKNVPDDRRWHDTEIDLDVYANQQITVTFRTDYLESSEWDWAGWGTPAIVTSP